MGLKPRNKGAKPRKKVAAVESSHWAVHSSAYLAAARASMASHVKLQAAKGRALVALFVGQWAAPFLILGIYNRLVKIHGSDSAGGGKAR